MQVNVAEAKKDLSKLIRLLENKKEKVIMIARNGKPVAKIEYYNEAPVSRRIGVAKGKINAPDDFDAANEEIYDMLTGDI